MGGDEFCILLPADGSADLVGRAQLALSESGEGFTVGASAGTVALPAEARTVSEALAIADRRMYAQKRGGRTSASNQSKDVLLRAVHERSPNLGAHGGEVAELAERTARQLGLEVDMVRAVRQGAELHDIGKLAIPDTILNKPGPLDDAEWGFMRRHTLVGERILAAAPALVDVAQARAREPRALGRRRLPRRARRRGDPARRARDRGLRRVGRDGHRPPVPARDAARARRWRSSSAAPARSSTRTVVEAFRAVLATPRRHLQALA